MFSRYFFGVLAVAALVVSAAVSTTAQVGELRGHVFMQQADGQKVPLADAQIDVVRTDVKGEYKTKTNKKGEFVFAGLPLIGEYSVAASHPTASPNFISGVKVGRDQQADIVVTPGDGKRLTSDEIKAANAGAKTTGAKTTGSSSGGTSSSGNSGESAADKAKREELIKKNKEIEESNRKITEANAIIARTFKAGNEALTAAGTATRAGNSQEGIAKYTEAINQYTEGLAADPEQPALLTNRAVALKGRGVEQFNASIKSADEAKKAPLMEAAKGDFKAAAESANKAVALLKAVPNPTDPAEQQRLNSNKYAAFQANAEAMRLYASKSDPSQVDAAVAAFQEFIAVETDPAKKLKAQLDLAKMLLDTGNSDKAFAEYKNILANDPNNVDANFGAGMALFGSGDKAKFQEAANYLQHFVDVAPDSDPYKADAKQSLDYLKTAEKVVPEKTPAPKRGTKRP